MTDLFDIAKPIIGMVHVDALPGTPRHRHPVSRIAQRAADEAKMLADHGVDVVMYENMHDRPYLNRRVGPEVTAAMSVIGQAVREAVGVPVGLQILAGANRQALAVAHHIGAVFVRVEGFVFAHVADEGLMADADAGPLLRYRRDIGADAVRIFADIKKKHSSHAITADVDTADFARAAEFFLADGVVVTGTATGHAAQPGDVSQAKKAVSIPVWVGSGITPENIGQFWEHADGFIVGSYIKDDGLWSNPPDPTRIRKLVEAAEQLR